MGGGGGRIYLSNIGIANTLILIFWVKEHYGKYVIMYRVLNLPSAHCGLVQFFILSDSPYSLTDCNG